MHQLANSRVEGSSMTHLKEVPRNKHIGKGRNCISLSYLMSEDVTLLVRTAVAVDRISRLPPTVTFNPRVDLITSDMVQNALNFFFLELVSGEGTVATEKTW